MAYEPPSEEQRNRRFRQSIGVIRNLARLTNVGVQNDPTGFGMGSQDLSQGAQHGVEAWDWQTHIYTTDGAARNHVIVQSSGIIVDGTGSTINLHYIDQTLHNGNVVAIIPAKGKTLVLKKATSLDNTQGNLYLTADITLAENEFVILDFKNDLGSAGGMYAVSKQGSGSAGFVTNPMTADLDAAQFSILNVKKITFKDSSIDALVRQIDVAAGSLEYIVSGSLVHRFWVGLDDIMDIGSTEVDLFKSLNMNSQIIKLAAGIEFSDPTRLIYGSAGASGIRVDMPVGENLQVQTASVNEYVFSSASLDFKNNSIINLNDILFNESGQTIISDSSGLHINVPTGDILEVLLNGVAKMRIDSLGMIMQTAIDMNGSLLGDVGSISMTDGLLVSFAASTFNFDFGAAQALDANRGGTQLLHLGSTSILRSDSKVLLRVTGAGDTIVFNDNTSDRLTYDWTTDDFYPVDGQSNLGRGANRWAEVFAVIGTINTSFSRFKNNIEGLDPSKCLDICKGLTPIKFRWKEPEYGWSKDKEKYAEMYQRDYVGFNADILETMLPEAIKGDGVIMNSVIGLILGAIQALDTKIANL